MLIFPAIRRFAPGDLLVGVRMVLVNFAKVAFAIVASTIAGLAFLAFRLLLPEHLAAAFVAAWLVLVVEGLATVSLAGVLFQQYDPSQHLLEGD